MNNKELIQVLDWIINNKYHLVDKFGHDFYLTIDFNDLMLIDENSREYLIVLYNDRIFFIELSDQPFFEWLN